jgi:hypothetical protein
LRYKVMAAIFLHDPSFISCLIFYERLGVLHPSHPLCLIAAIGARNENEAPLTHALVGRLRTGHRARLVADPRRSTDQ